MSDASDNGPSRQQGTIPATMSDRSKKRWSQQSRAMRSQQHHTILGTMRDASNIRRCQRSCMLSAITRDLRNHERCQRPSSDLNNYKSCQQSNRSIQSCSHDNNCIIIIQHPCVARCTSIFSRCDVSSKYNASSRCSLPTGPCFSTGISLVFK